MCESERVYKLCAQSNGFDGDKKMPFLMVFLEAKSGRRHNNVSDNQIKPTGKEF